MTAGTKTDDETSGSGSKTDGETSGCDDTTIDGESSPCSDQNSDADSSADTDESGAASSDPDGETSGVVRLPVARPRAAKLMDHLMARPRAMRICLVLKRHPLANAQARLLQARLLTINSRRWKL